MKEHTLKQLADLGADAAFANNKGDYYMSVSKKSHSWELDRPAREAFAKAVRDAVLADLVTKSDSLPDLYAELKAAKKAGKAIEVFIPDDEYGPDRWSLQENDTWAGGPDRYRIKPEPVLIPLDIDDIRATDEFKPLHGKTIHAPLFWDSQNVKTVRGFNTYEELAANYLRRQHGSNEWKPCTKESK